MVRAKFLCQSIESTLVYGGKPGQTQEVVKLSAVNDPANKNWSQYTPSGTISMSITNPEAVKQFVIGEHYYVDFSPAQAIEAPQV